VYRSKKPGRKLNAEINVVPYIDVMMVLLVIFMVTAPLLTQGVAIDLPQALSNPLDVDKNREPLIVSVTKQGDYYLELGENNQQPVSLARIKLQVSKIMQQQPDTTVLLKGDRDVDYGKIMQLMTILQQAGVPDVGLVSEVP